MGLTADTYKLIAKSYDYKRTKNKNTLHLRQQEIYDKIHEIKELDQQIAAKGLETSKSIFKDTNNRLQLLNSLKQDLLTLKERKLALLESNGYPRDYLNPIYDCENCQDTGYVNDKKCFCFHQALIHSAYESSHLKNILEKENFSTFSFQYYSKEVIELYGVSPYDNMKGVYNRCLRFVEEFDQEFSNLILFGQTGLGKTFLCNCIAKALLDRSHSVLYLTSFHLFKLLESYRFRSEETEVTYENIEDIYNCDLLIIDDLGSEVINSFTSSELFHCINTRLLDRKSTVISTNLDPAGWSKHYSTRIVSRILGNFIPLQLLGEDIRVQKYI